MIKCTYKKETTTREADMAKKQKKVSEVYVMGRSAFVQDQKVQVFAHRNTKRAKTRSAQKARALTDW